MALGGGFRPAARSFRIMRKALVSIALALTVAPTAAFAASLALADGSLAAGAAPVVACDSGFTISYTTSGGNVTGVTVGDIADPACEGGALSVALTDSGGAAIASGGAVTVPTDGDASPDAVTVPVNPTPAAESVAAVAVVIAGP